MNRTPANKDCGCMTLRLFGQQLSPLRQAAKFFFCDQMHRSLTRDRILHHLVFNGEPRPFDNSKIIITLFPNLTLL